MAGDGSAAPEVSVRLSDPRAVRRLLISPQLALGEAYMERQLEMEQGDIGDLLDILGRNLASRGRRRPGWMAKVKGTLSQANHRRLARRNVAHHYDLSLDLYQRFLDEDLQYSCAFFEQPDLSLEAAQAAKKHRLMSKLLLRPHHRVLDIGCGWGGLCLTLAEAAGVQAKGVTLSMEQLLTARARVQARGLAGKVEFALEDYRDVEGAFDRIVSVGMLEHVGAPNYRTYFEAVARLLDENGVAVIHSIGINAPSGRVQPWIGKYIFPGGYIPALSEVLPAIERAGLWVTDVEVLRLHYAQTLKAWRERFQAQRADIAELYDERFCRMWEFYLALSEMAFRWRGCMVFQIQLAKRVDAVPLTRSYMA